MIGVPANTLPTSLWAVVEAATDDGQTAAENTNCSLFTLPEPAFTVLIVQKVQGLVDNEDLESLFEHDLEENPSYRLLSDAFRRIGASEAADCIDAAAKMFPGEAPHLDCEMRRDFMACQKQLRGTQRSPINELGDRITNLGATTMLQLTEYIRAHPEHFPSAKHAVLNSGTPTDAIVVTPPHSESSP
jgi:hypothetical protein